MFPRRFAPPAAPDGIAPLLDNSGIDAGRRQGRVGEHALARLRLPVVSAISAAQDTASSCVSTMRTRTRSGYEARAVDGRTMPRAWAVHTEQRPIAAHRAGQSGAWRCG